MSKISKQSFQRLHADKAIDIKKVQQDEVAKGELAEAGLSVDQLRQADINKDGKIDPGEAFTLADRFDTEPGTPETLVAKEGGAPTAAGKSLNALGAMLEARIGDAGAPRLEVDLDRVEHSFNRAARKLRKDPAAIHGMKAEFQAIIDELDPVIVHKEGLLAALSTKLAGKEELLNWFERNIGLFSPPEVRELRSEVKQERSYLSEAKAYRGGARIALRTGRGDNPEFDATKWSAGLDAAVNAIPGGGGPDHERGVAVLVRLQDGLVDVTDRAHLDQQSVEQDVGDLKQEVAWHQRWKWVDVIIGGESDRGALYRTGKSLNKESTEIVKDLDEVQASGEQRTRHQVSELLKLESPEYKEMRDRYDLLKPAHDGLNEVLSSAREAQSYLDDAERWIDRRNFLKMTEPTEYETVREPRYKYEDGQRVQDGYDTVTRETQAHKSWQSDYDHAKHQAMWASSSAESEVNDVNRELPGLERALRAVQETGSLSLVDDDISVFWGEMSGFGVWSYDSSQVDAIQDQLSRLEGQLHQIKGRVDPEFNRHQSYVFAKIAERRDQLRTLHDA
jgi:hypothetical protein